MAGGEVSNFGGGGLEFVKTPQLPLRHCWNAQTGAPSLPLPLGKVEPRDISFVVVAMATNYEFVLYYCVYS